MKIKKMLISMLSLSLLSVSDINIVNAGANNISAPEAKYESEYNVSYYKDIQGLKGDELLEGLALISQDNHKTFTSYDDLKGGLAISDEDPNDSSKVIDFYTGWSLNNTWCKGTSSEDYINPWNREHVWCKNNSGGLFEEKYAGSDIHHLRVENYRINSSRGDNPFAELTNASEFEFEDKYNNKKIKTGCKNSGGYFEPRDESKGDVARILMYMYMHYSNEVENNKNYSPANKDGAIGLRITKIVYTPAGSNDAAWNMLLKWNVLDPVDELETNRNDYCASLTGVRNPFIDHQEFANMIWNSSYSGDGALNDVNIPTDPVEPDTPVVPDEPIEPTPNEESKTYIISDYTSGTQYKENELHKLDDNVSITTTQCYFTSELRIYSSSTHNGYVVIDSKQKINKISLSLGYEEDTLNIYQSDDKSNWSLNTSVTSSSSSYNDYETEISPSSNYLKLDVKGSNQLRIKSLTLFFEDENDIIDKIKQIETKTQLDFSYSYKEGTSENIEAKSIVQEDVTYNESISNYASNINLDSNVFNVNFIKGDPTSPVIKDDGTIRLYANRKSGNGNTLIIELKNKDDIISNISFTSTNSDVLVVKDSKGNIITPINNIYKINDYKFTIQNTHYDADASNNKNAFISLIDINYNSETYIYSDFNSINLRYSALIPNELFEQIDSYGVNIKINDNSKDYEINKTNDVNNSKEFALIIKNIKDYNIEITATAYVYIDNERIELISKTYSISSMIDYYLLNATSLNLTSSQINVLNSFKEYLKNI